MIDQVLMMLKQTDSYVSGQEICDGLGVSRTAVWKMINKLKQEGYDIKAVSHKGYRLLSYPDLLSEKEILGELETKQIGRSLVYLPVTDSTNNIAKQLAEQGAGHGLLVTADSQTAGRGRRGHIWKSPPKTTISMSLVLRPEIEPNRASMLTLVTAMAVCEAIHKLYGDTVDTKIKWPNDVVVGGKKVCGILTEMSTDMESIHYVIIGIGINVTNEAFDPEIEAVATSLLQESGNSLVHRSQVIGAVCNAFEKYYQQFLKDQDLSGLKAEYESKLVNIHKQVSVIEKNGTRTGKALGIDEEGCLLVEFEGHKVEKVMAGEVSVRGIYGYV